MRLYTLIFLMDFLVSITSWYIYIFLISSIYKISYVMFYFAIFYIARLSISSLISFILSYIADVKGIGKVMKIVLLSFPLLSLLSLFHYTLLFLYILTVFFEVIFTSYSILKYSLVPKISTKLDELNSAYELSYAISMILGPLLSLALLRFKVLLLLSVLPLILFIFIDKNIDYIHRRSKKVFKIEINWVFISYLLVAVAGSIVNLTLVNVAEKIGLFLVDFSLINALLGLGSAISSVIVSMRKSVARSEVFLSSVVMSLYPLVILLCYTDLAYAYLFLAFSVLNGFFNSIFSIFITSKIQRQTEYTSTTFSLLFLLSNLISIPVLYIQGMFFLYISFFLLLSSLLLFLGGIIGYVK